VEAQTVDDLVDRLALGAEGDADEIEIFGGDVRDRGSVRLVVVRREELLRIDRRSDTAAHRALVGPPESRPVGLVHEHGLNEHRQVLGPRCVPVRLTDDAGDGSGDPADEERRDVRLLPCDEVVPKNDGDLRVELNVVTLAARDLPVERRRSSPAASPLALRRRLPVEQRLRAKETRFRLAKLVRVMTVWGAG
jgi:hypothetical protein